MKDYAFKCQCERCADEKRWEEETKRMTGVKKKPTAQVKAVLDQTDPLSIDQLRQIVQIQSVSRSTNRLVELFNSYLGSIYRGKHSAAPAISGTLYKAVGSSGTASCDLGSIVVLFAVEIRRSISTSFGRCNGL